MTRSAPLAASLLLWLAGSAQAATRDADLLIRPIQPETAASGHQTQGNWQGQRMAAATANPLATAAAIQTLRAGGNALDSAIAAQMVLALVEPQSSGIGGGAFLLYYNGKVVEAWDGRETAPRGIGERLFLDADGKPLPFLDAVDSGLSVGVPGMVAMLERAHRRHGHLPWAVLLLPAIELADQGFAVSPRLHSLLASDPLLRKDPAAARFYYHADGSPLAIGERLRNPALAEVLRRIARQGSKALHTGTVARALVTRVQTHARPGKLDMQDLRYYQPVQREPLCRIWRTRYRICGFPPPSSGWLTSMQILGLLEQLPPQAQPLAAGLPTADFLHRYTEASRLAFADRARYIADPDFVKPPAGNWLSLLGPDYLRQRAALIGEQAMSAVQPGNPGSKPLALASQPEQPEYGTSHISIIDAQGRALAMTSSIEQAFGSRMLVDGGTGLPGGFLLNNQLTDFAFIPRGEGGLPVANRPQPGKRPRSSMNPLLVFDARSGRVLASLGSPGGTGIIHFTARSLLGVLEWGRSPAQTVRQPNFASFGGPLLLEQGRFAQATIEALRQRGHQVQEVELTSGLQILLRSADGLQGASDPRREGVVDGD